MNDKYRPGKNIVDKHTWQTKFTGFGLLLLTVALVLVPQASADTLTSVKATTAPVIDGIPDSTWDKAIPLTINVSGGANSGSHTVILKSIYTDDSVYFIAKWDDPTESLRRLPWQKQANGTWKQLNTPDVKEGGEETYYEDKLSQIWNINITGFEASGCSVTCHAGENSDIKAYGNMYTAGPGEIGDMWHMKIVRTNTTGFVDDQYIDSTRYSNTTADAGRHSDPGLAPYYNNINPNGTAPNSTSADQPAPPYWIFDDEKQPFNDTYNTGDEIAGIIVRPPTEDRADIRGKAVYMDGNWTLEYGRKLVTGSQFDIQFSDLKNEYLFGTAVFDNAQTRHSYGNGAIKLVFAAPANITDNIRRPTEIIDNMTGTPVINESTEEILAEDFMNFSTGDPYSITITRVIDGVVEFNKSGTLMGLNKETITLDWIPTTQGSYILRSNANTTADARIVKVINQKVISPIPELSTIALVSAGLIGLLGLVSRRRSS